MKAFAIAAFFAAGATMAPAATVATGSTLVGDTGGINAEGAAVNYGAAVFGGLTMDPTDPASVWVWANNGATPDTPVFEFEFDMAGFDVSTAALEGQWAVDNNAWAYLNGTLIASLTGTVVDNFNFLHDYGTSDASLFNAGLNTLRFEAEDLGGFEAFRASVTVSADALAPVPLPASALLLLLGVGGLGAIRRRSIL
ncbi:VPLPA-CTERM sorting domain-containing protein [Pacificoceanicola onchidii]|uniref:VPLPA-CTERM sorting domain-containing protein n=1 Tax=Pacificoceanicola onchidii TaxID=2562685 RepID=UPI001F0F472F|nr:VPLPA-CTERM sorting domain-containing protein [Pacificoceanicola onchidii]